MNWSPSWSSNNMAPPETDPAYSPLRTSHGTSGLFDEGLAGDAKLKALSAQSSELSQATTTDNLSLELDSADLLEAFGDIINANTAGLPNSDVDALQPGNCGEVDLACSIGTIKSEFDQMITETGDDDNVFYPSIPADVSGLHEEDSLLRSIQNSDFLEHFTDLSSFSTNGDMTNNPVTFDPDLFMTDMCEIEGIIGKPQPVKRSASDAFNDDEVSCTAGDELKIVNPDHNDYTRKAVLSEPIRPAKRARTSTVTSESDAESVVSSTSFSVVPTSGSKDVKYMERRRKNNIASKRSRETRKQKFVGMERQAEELEDANAKLRIKVAELEKLTKLMKDTLVQKLSQAGRGAATATS